jgi:hypothetical protein
MSTDPVKTESSLEEQLVAYLDGELDAEAVRRIEARLAAEPEVREALNRLERTWEMLDELGATPVGDSFTRTTLEMVTVAAEEDVERVMADVPLRRRRRWSIAAGVLAATAAGFLAAYLSLPNTNRQLLENLPVLENLEEYRQVDDIEFLRLMKEKSLFPPLPTAESAVKEHPQAEGKSPLELAKWVESLPNDKKADLLRKQESFDKLDPAERAKLQRLHQEIQNDQDAAELRRIAHDYYEWWFNLPTPYEKNALSILASPQARIERIEQKKQEEFKRNPSKNLPERDLATLREWLEQYVKKFETRRLASMSEAERKKWDAMPERERQQEFAGFLFWRRGQGWGNRTLQSPEDLTELRAKLSRQTQQLLEGKPPEEQLRTIQSWLIALARQQFAFRMGRRPGALVDENEIAQFFEKDLPPTEKERLLNLPPEDMLHELQRMYMARMQPMGSLLGRPDGPPPGGPRGPRNNSERRPPNKPE